MYAGLFVHRGAVGVVAALAALAGAGGTPVQGQPTTTASTAPPGTEVRVRVHVNAVDRTLRGVLLSRTDAGIVILGGTGRPDTIPASALLRLEVSRGRSRARGALKGLGLGAAVGAAALGVAIAIEGADPGPGCEVGCTAGSGFALGAVLGAILGGPVGALVGAVRGSQRWERVPARTGQGQGPR